MSNTSIAPMVGSVFVWVDVVVGIGVVDMVGPASAIVVICLVGVLTCTVAEDVGFVGWRACDWYHRHVGFHGRGRELAKKQIPFSDVVVLVFVVVDTGM